ncbi:pilus assembly protein TadE [Rhodococcus rhodnii]|uniref:Pilus assembly protein TadE n=2 Tax=Rhodococcus rhodnii TaxID=38312 RepID=R7WI13_9NOCA|nr:TadE family type IV pilus minor pilin [Rhodococcus rhodnii]EOM74798.1 hypothetical protein Rrhod_3879 [Rhodococcus rhodnii LMG 5362]TXG89305.1 pilus assembly protein TadE [Rhodococcus rhodnii]
MPPSSDALRRDDGGVTVEAALAIASIVTVLVLSIGALLAVTMHVRCVDSAREAARLVARGESGQARSVAARIAPEGAVVDVRVEGDYVVATVSARSPALPLVDVSAVAVAVLEPGVR